MIGTDSPSLTVLQWIVEQLRSIFRLSLFLFFGIIDSKKSSVITTTNNIMAATTQKLKPVQRKVEALVGVPLLKFLSKLQIKSCGLVGPKKVFLPNCGITMNYYEREAMPQPHGPQQQQQQQRDPPTLLLLHGISSSANEFCDLIRLLDVPAHIRILVPEQIGHGQDLKRAKLEGSAFQQPTPESMLESTSELLEVVKAGNNCNAMGTSMGGALLYFLKLKDPTIIRKTILVEPALGSVLAKPFLDDLISGKQSVGSFRSRDDVKNFFRNYLWTDPTRQGKQLDCDKDAPTIKIKKDPIPAFFYEVIYRSAKLNAPEGHWKALLDNLLQTYGLLDNDSGNVENSYEYADVDADDASGLEPTTAKAENIYTATTDLDQDTHRLVVWGEEDQICNIEQGKRFFGPSMASGKTRFETIPNCGHVFAADGTSIYELVGPMVEKSLLDFS
mmetsp:Transcript_25052/g.28039  ORF Transcript_25052/g.28039 Transcript_25052/m.28039 type:complete len:445 (-) Transcript_25052:115-1449(-)